MASFSRPLGDPEGFAISPADPRMRLTYQIRGRSTPDHRVQRAACNSVFSTATRTYFRSGRRVRDHTMAEIPPTISSSEGASPEDDQIPFST